MKMIPQKVKTEFRTLSAMYGEHNIVHIGTRKCTEYFLFKFPDNTETGFPNVIAYKNGEIMSITGFDAINIVASFNPED